MIFRLIQMILDWYKLQMIFRLVSLDLDLERIFGVNGSAARIFVSLVKYIIKLEKIPIKPSQ